MAQIPMTAVTATKRAPKRSSANENPLRGNRRSVWTTAT